MLFSLPDKLPSDGGEAQTGIACPDCSGTLVLFMRKTFAAFRCRVGHAYSLPEVLAAKEELLERRLWEVVASMEELADLLDTAAREGFAYVDAGAFRRRSAVARGQAAAVRSIISPDRPLRMKDAVDAAPAIEG